MKRIQKPMSERVPFDFPKNSDPTEQNLHTLNAFLEELETLSMRVQSVIAKMGRNGIKMLPEATREFKHVRGVNDLTAFIDGLEQTLTHEIRANVDIVSDENSPASDAPD